MNKGLKPVEGIYFRCTSRKREPLDTTGALLNCGRYNVVGCAALYLASSPNLAVSEHLHLNEMFEIRQFPPRLLVSVRVNLARVLDLTDNAVLHQLGVSQNALSSPYSDDPDAPSVTQLIAIQARRAGIEALIAPSALYPEHHNLVVFRDNLHSPAAVEVIGFDDHVDAQNVDDSQ